MARLLTIILFLLRGRRRWKDQGGWDGKVKGSFIMNMLTLSDCLLCHVLPAYQINSGDESY